MAGSEEIWRAVVDFCEEVMLQKETAERIRRQKAALPAPAGAAAAVATATRRRGRRRRTAGGAPTPLSPLRPNLLEGAEGWRYARGGPHLPRREDEVKGEIYNNVGITPTRIPPPSIPFARANARDGEELGRDKSLLLLSAPHRRRAKRGS